MLRIQKSVNRSICIMLTLFALISHQAVATAWSDNLYLNGYFTLEMSLTDQDIVALSSISEPRPYSKDEPLLKNSLVGGQLEYQINDELSFFAQGVAYYNADGQGTGNVNWAYLSYDFSHDIKGRVGVFQTPFLQGTELRTVGYSRLWARPLTPGSGASGINYYQGIDVVKRLNVGKYNWQFQFSIGNGEHDLNDVDIGGVQLLSAKVSSDSNWLRSAIMHADYSVYTPKGNLITDSGNVLMLSLEAQYSLSQFIVNLGYSASDSDVTPNDTMNYFSVGYTLNDITPYVIWTSRNQLFEAFEVPNNLPPPPPNVIPPVDSGLNGELPDTPEGNADLTGVGLGARWNFAQQLALKFQYEQVTSSDDTDRMNAMKNASGSVVSVVLEGAF